MVRKSIRMLHICVQLIYKHLMKMVLSSCEVTDVMLRQLVIAPNLRRLDINSLGKGHSDISSEGMSILTFKLFTLAGL